MTKKTKLPASRSPSTSAKSEERPFASTTVVRNHDEHSVFLHNFDQTYHQISPGNYLGWSKSFHLGENCFAQLEAYNQTLDQWGYNRPGLISVVFFMTQSRGSRLGHHPMTQDDLLLHAPGGDFDLQSGDSAVYGAIVFPLDYLTGFMSDEVAAAFAHKGNTFPTIKLSRPRAIAALRQRMRQLAKNFSTFDAAVCPLPLDDLRHELASFAAGLVASVVGRPSTPFRPSTKSTQLAFDIRDFLRTACDSRITVAQLAEQFEISTRYVERVFKKAFDLKPREYANVILLNKFRSALLDPSNEDRSIGDIAAEFELWHLSRLAQSYRSQFCELPSARNNHTAHDARTSAEESGLWRDFLSDQPDIAKSHFLAEAQRNWAIFDKSL